MTINLNRHVDRLCVYYRIYSCEEVLNPVLGVYFAADRLRGHFRTTRKALVKVQSTTEEVLDVETDVELYMLLKEVDLKKHI